MEKGYKLKANNMWLAVRRFYGNYVVFQYEDDQNPNVAAKATLNVAEKLKRIAEDYCSIDNIEIVECGDLSEEEQELDIGKHLTKRRIK